MVVVCTIPGYAREVWFFSFHFGMDRCDGWVVVIWKGGKKTGHQRWVGVGLNFACYYLVFPVAVWCPSLYLGTY